MTNTVYDDKFSNKPMWPLVMEMAIPSVAAQIVNLLYSIVDRIYIGHIPEIGTAALAGVGICTTLILLISAFPQFVGGGGAPLASIALGKGEEENASKIMNNGIVMLVGFAIMSILVCGVFMIPLLTICGASVTTMPFAKEYLSIYLIGTFFVEVTIGMNPFLNVQGRAKTAMLSVMIGAGCNIILDPIFIFGLHMGVAGAAIATVISQGISAAWILYALRDKNSPLRIRKEHMRIELGILKQIVSLGISPFVMGATESVIGFVLNGSLAKYGDIYVSSLTVMQSAMQIVGVPCSGFGQGVIPVISYNYGHHNVERVKQAFKCMLKVMFTYNFVLTLIAVVFPRFTAGLFTNDAVLIDTVGKTMPWFMSGMLIFGMQRACQNTFVATNQAGASLFIALLRKIFLLVPLVYILPHFIEPGYNGVYLAESIADMIAATLCMILFLIRFPKILKKIEK